MIKISVMYPNEKGKWFDIEYYENKHMPMVKGRLGDTLKGYGVDHAICESESGVASPYIAVGYLLFESFEQFQKEYLPQRDEVKKDIPNYTDIEPVVQISEIVC